ncbi:hypothetical protein GCM10007216_04130 [Thalassobacillus devorans]|uniref:DUF3231 family protein n=1 Tax=Thalassobacillus devorans TaxID=279813 RepID=A0ABQ1NGR3_9BACI|nr:DUF3231 family protein [Thalassobacillus devorans]NIK27321.1 hypothetical protein [Thalassobacillus devorans]GGC76775.1 hypothetical protein GCM10007216_04130 [Thalassobacillus devorans]
MDKEELKLTSAEIGTLWGEYVNGTAVDIVNKYMLSIIEDEKIKEIFEDAIKIFGNQKQQIKWFIENEGFPVPVGFSESDLNRGTKRLFSDIFCLHYLHIMTLHGLIGHTTSLSSSVRRDLRHFYESASNDAMSMYQRTTDLLLEKGHFQRDPYFYPEKKPEFVSGQQFINGFSGDKRPLAATEIIALSLNIKKKIMEKSLSIGFSQVAQSKEVRKFLESTQNASNQQIQSLSKILKGDNLPVPMSWESEVTSSQDSPFSDKLMLYHMGFLLQSAQSYHGAGLASAMRVDLVTTFEKIILKNIMITKEWFNIMTKNNWLEQPPLAPNRKDIAKDK